MSGVKDFKFIIDEESDGVVIQSCISDRETIVIPAFVTGIKDKAFKEVKHRLKVIYKGEQIKSLEGVFMEFGGDGLDLSEFNTSNIVNMERLFGWCRQLRVIDLSNFSTGNVVNMCCMFAGCKSLQKLDLSNFNTGNVTDMHGMFLGCESLEELDLDSFDIGNVEDIGCMFYKCSKLKY